MQFHKITHKNLIVQEKVNFFADYFIFLVQRMGKQSSLPMDNPLARIEKMIWQLTRNEKQDTITQNLKNHIEGFILDFPEYFKDKDLKDMEPMFTDICSLSRKPLREWFKEHRIEIHA